MKPEILTKLYTVIAVIEAILYVFGFYILSGSLL